MSPMHTNSLSQDLFIPNLPTGVEDTEGWAFRRARTHEATLSPEEVLDAGIDGVDIRALDRVPRRCPGFARFNGRWFRPSGFTTVSSGLNPTSNPMEFVPCDSAECSALERVREHWRTCDA